MACVRRFGLELDTDATRFIAEIMSINDRPRRHRDLNEAQRTHLDEWIKALYDDEGISDELMSTCPPQEFYRIVGTLFRVSLNAYKTGALSKEKFHSGLEREYCTIHQARTEADPQSNSSTRTVSLALNSLCVPLACQPRLGDIRRQ